jgi:hypothetical protein
VLAKQEASAHFFRDAISVKCLRPLCETSHAPFLEATPFCERRQMMENRVSAQPENCSALRITSLKNCWRSELRFCRDISPAFPRGEKLVFTLTSNLRVAYCSPATAMLRSLRAKQ